MLVRRYLQYDIKKLQSNHDSLKNNSNREGTSNEDLFLAIAVKQNVISFFGCHFYFSAARQGESPRLTLARFQESLSEENYAPLSKALSYRRKFKVKGVLPACACCSPSCASPVHGDKR